MDDLIQNQWTFATVEEREALEPVYDSLKRIPTSLPKHVRYAHIIEILEEHDYRVWPSGYQLHDVIPSFQEAIQLAVEHSCVDSIQRRNYMILALAGQNRHLDVSYGLSESLLWKESAFVIEKLLEMGRREYTAPIPTAHEMENGVLHVALSYRHCNRFDDGGTLGEAQADAAWHAVRALPTVTEDTRVRVWVDQNLHRASFPDNVEWHEYGLLPYACLQIVFVGDGSCSLRHANTRPWLWVELLAGLKAHGIHSKSDIDIMADCADVLQITNITNRLPDLNESAVRKGFLVPPGRNVDQVMHELVLNIAMWRKTGFLAHDDYEYAHDFERFVNWSRRFLIRGLPYSRMSWNHNSDDVVGMDAIVLLREMPRPAQDHIEAIAAISQPRVSWRRDSPYANEWTIGDVVDRTGIDEIPLRLIMEVAFERSSDYSDIVLFGKSSCQNRLRLRMLDDTIHFVMESDDAPSAITFSRFAQHSFQLVRQYGCGSPTVRFGTSNAGDLLTYMPFTRRVLIARGFGRTPIGDAEANVRSVSDNVKSALSLRSVGVCVHVGICEEVFAVPVGDENVTYLSTMELISILQAVRGNVVRFREIVAVLKRNASYKWMRFRDLSADERIEMAKGWVVQNVDDMRNERIMSGEMDADVSEELIDLIRRRNETCSLVTRMVFFDEHRAVIVFRGRRRLTRMRFEDSSAKGGTAILQEVDDKMLERVIHVMGNVKVNEKMTLIKPPNWSENAHNGDHVQLVEGMFVRCTQCQRVVCPLNGLVAETQEGRDRVDVRWLEEHNCHNGSYDQLSF